ncbi:MAG: MFS transporter [Patescibacteria group bacterium]|nr:MFS transporter [Patescibacteria group bacterium]
MGDAESKRNLWLFATASFLNDLGHFLFTAIWPVFVTVTIGASVTFLGFIDGFGTALESISQAVSGLLSDKMGKRKVFIWLGYLLPSIASLIYASSRNPFQLFVGKFFDRSGKLRDAPRDAIIADETEHSKRATAFGFLRAADRGGALLGLAISAALVSYLTYRQLFWLSAIPGFIGTAIILFLIRENKKAGDGKDGVSLSLNKAGRSLKIFTVLSLIFTLGSFSDSFYILTMKDRGVSLAVIPLVYLVYVFVSFASAIPFGKLADRVGRKTVMALSYLLLAITNALFIFSGTIFSFALAFAAYGLHYGAYKGNIKTFVADLSPRDLRASFLGGFEMLLGLVSLPASVIAGVLWQGVAPAAAFLFSILMSAVALILMPLVTESKKDVA